MCGVHYHGPTHGRDGTPPEGEKSLLSDDAEKGIKNVLVVSSLVDGKVAVRGHADQSNLDRIKEVLLRVGNSKEVNIRDYF